MHPPSVSAVLYVPWASTCGLARELLECARCRLTSTEGCDKFRHGHFAHSTTGGITRAWLTTGVLPQKQGLISTLYQGDLRALPYHTQEGKSVRPPWIGWWPQPRRCRGATDHDAPVGAQCRLERSRPRTDRGCPAALAVTGSDSACLVRSNN